MMLLTDIEIEHTKKSRIGEPDVTSLMHPFENTQGPNAGKYEILRDIADPGQRKRKRSTHLTLMQLAELYARGYDEAFSIRLRLRPANGSYPTAPPAKKVPFRWIKTGSDFHRRVLGIDTNTATSEGLQTALKRMNVHI